MRFTFFILLVFFPFFVFAQVIKGKIIDGEGNGLEKVSVSIKNTEKPDLIVQFTISKKDGSYQIPIKKEFKSILLEFSKSNYENETIKLEIADFEETYEFNIEMYKNTVELESVTIGAKPKIQIKKDTIIFNASSYLSGTERKVEDLLRNLPGVEVNDEGEIKFKGQPLEKLLLEGEDLFGSNYAVGTKNMNVDYVSEVEVIENYSDNFLLSGVQDSQKIAINLIVKKNMLDISGSGDFGYGIENRNATYLNLLALTQKFKSFYGISYNNLGENRSPYDYFSYNLSSSDKKDQGYKTSKLLNEAIFTSSLDKFRSNLNDNWFNYMYNSFKLSDKLNLNLNLAYYKDEIDFFGQSESNYFFEGNEELNINEKSHIQKKPELFIGEIKMLWNSSKNSLFEFSSEWTNENIITESNILSNHVNNLYSRLKSESFFTKQEILFTQKLNSKNVMQFKALFSRSDVPQVLTLNPGLQMETGEVLNDGYNRQLSNLSKDHYEFGSTLISVVKKNSLQISFLGKWTDNNLNTELLQEQNSLNDYMNQLNYGVLELALEAAYSLKFKNLKLNPKFKGVNYHLNKRDLIELGKSNKSKIVINPSINAEYKLSEMSKLKFNYNYNESPKEISNIFTQYVLSSYRSLYKYSGDDSFSKIHSGNFEYDFRDFYNQFGFNLNLFFTKSENSFYINNEVLQNLSFYDFFMLNKGTEFYKLTLTFEKYLPLIQSTIKLSNGFHRSEYKNIINDSELRANVSDTYSLKFFVKTAFNIPVNLENEFLFLYDMTRSKNVVESFNMGRLHNNTKLMIKPDRNWILSSSFDYYQTNIKNSNEYYFLDLLIRYKMPNKVWSFGVSAKNVTNNKIFNEYSVSDYYESSYSQSLNKAYLLFELGISF